MSYRIRILNPDLPIHVTGRCNNREEFPLPLDQVWKIMEMHLHTMFHATGVRIINFVLMPNHFHMICRDPHQNLSTAMQHFMRDTAKEINRLSGRENRLWGAPFYSSNIKSPLHFLNAYKYVYRNPVAAGLAASSTEYPWSTIGQMLGQFQCLIPLEEDHTFFSDPEGVIKWIDQSFTEEEASCLRRGLKKKEFELSRESHRAQPLRIETWASIPFGAPHV